MIRQLPLIALVFAVACSKEEPTDTAAPPVDQPDPTVDTTDTDPPDDTTDTDDTPDTDTDPPTGVTGGVVDAFGTSQDFVVVGSHADGLRIPRDLAFDPLDPELLWTVNQENDGVVLFRAPGEPAQAVESRVDFDANHFMEEVSSIALSQDDALFGSCQESRNTYDGQQPPSDFMGPVLWPSDLAVFAVVDGGLGSHVDMLHQSPLCVGIEWDTGNAYWVFDGMNGDLVRYDFQVPHKVGKDDHSDGVIERHTDVKLTRVAGVPGHLALDRASGILYVADTGTGRVLAVDPSTAGSVGKLFAVSEILDSYTEWNGATVTVLASGLTEPSGIAVADGLVFVSDHGTGEILAFDVGGTEHGRIALPDGPGVMGIEIAPDGKLWYVDGVHETLVRVDAIP